MSAWTSENKRLALHLAITDAGYTAAQADRGIAYADQQRHATERDRFLMALSRILYSDTQLAAGARFAG